MNPSPPVQPTPRADERKIKCLVWDLDHTLWDGVLLEEPGNVAVRPGASSVIKTLDARGILHSIASRNDPGQALDLLQKMGLAEYFLYPEIGWNPKSVSLKRIAQSLNIGLDSLAFVDDQPFEREEVAYSLPDVLCVDAADLDHLPARPEFNPRFVTEDSRLRRQMYLNDRTRRAVEETFEGSNEEFLATLGMRLSISRAREEDLRRAEELTLRTHQLNTTGYTYSYEELKGFAESPSHRLLIAGLEDKFGSYGKIGLALLETQEDFWTIKLLLMSCRVLSRGVGTVFLGHIMREARANGVRLRAEFAHNGRNRMMHVTYKFAGFQTLQTTGEGQVQLLESRLEQIQEPPGYMEVIASS